MNIWKTEDQTGQYAWANSSLSLILRRHPGLLGIPQGGKPTWPTQWKQSWKESNGESSFSKPFWHLPGTRPHFRFIASLAESVPVWDPLKEHYPDYQFNGACRQWPEWPGACLPVLVSCCQGDKASILVVTYLGFILEQGKGHLAEGWISEQNQDSLCKE